MELKLGTTRHTPQAGPVSIARERQLPLFHHTWYCNTIWHECWVVMSSLYSLYEYIRLLIGWWEKISFPSNNRRASSIVASITLRTYS